jgi:hypothetical protein
VKRNFPWLIFLGALACGFLNSGCLVVSSNHVSKPIAAKETVELCHDEYAVGDAGWYIHHVHSSDVDFDVSVHNNAERFEMGFLFWVLPVPYFKSEIPDAAVELDLRPREGNQIAVNPWHIEFHPVEDVAISPAKIWRKDNGSWKPVPKGQLTIDKTESLRLEYNAPCNPDFPFTLVIAGVPTSDQKIIAINYERAKLFQTGFKLPY